jgi:hypothetical protein
MAAFPSFSSAQELGVLESAETINQGNFKLMAAPLFVFGDRADETLIVLGAGYGVTPDFDIEGRVAFGDATIFGGNAECWLMKHDPVDLSLNGGLHYQDNDGPFNLFGIDVGLLASGHVADRLEVYGALDIAFKRFTEDPPFDRTFTQVHLVPGIEYAISDQLDFVAEIGLGVTDSSTHYFGGGLAYYLR